MARLDADLLRSLAERRAASPSLVSCYCDLDPATVPTESELSSHVTSLVDELGRVAGKDARESARRIAAFLEGELDRAGAHGLAVFAASESDLVDVPPARARAGRRSRPPSSSLRCSSTSSTIARSSSPRWDVTAGRSGPFARVARGTSTT